MDTIRWWLQDLELPNVVTVVVMGLVELSFIGFLVWASFLR